MGQHGCAAASRLLGLDGFEVLAAEMMGGEWQLKIQTTATVADRAGPDRGVSTVGTDAYAVAAVARDPGVGWATIMGAVADHGTPLVEDPARWVTGLVDLTGGRLPGGGRTIRLANTVVGGPNRPPSGIGAASGTRCTASASCC